MMKRILMVASLCCMALFVFAQDEVTVFESGKEGYKSFRIPAVIALPNGDLLAFAEGRIHSSSDFGDINIVTKRSSDKGRTWSALQMVVDYGDLQAGNPAPVVDLTDPAYPKGRLFLFYNTGNVGEWEIRSNKGYKQVWYKTSIDNGATWSEPVDITTQVHRQNKPDVNPDWAFKEAWRYYANTPGHAMQLESGKYRGRIFVAANHSAGAPQQQFTDYAAHGFYTDDHGKTFHLSETVNVPGGNESMAAELSGGRLMMNTRNQRGDIRARIVSISSDGGQSWDTTYLDRALIDPVCQGSILTIGRRKNKNILAFCNAASERQRDSLTLRISYDDGSSWKKSILVDKGEHGNARDYTAYSDIVGLGRKKIGVLYERARYKEIVFKTIKY